jgi:hypothetical protein
MDLLSVVQTFHAVSRLRLFALAFFPDILAPTLPK